MLDTGSMLSAMNGARRELLIAEELKNRFNTVGVLFLRTELDTALTLAQIALDTKNNPAKRIRYHANAQKAYDTAVSMSRRLHMTEADRRELESKRRAAQRALEELFEATSHK